jgi:predicted nucleotidyltransferase
MPIEDFQNDLKKIPIEQVLFKHLLSGECAALSNEQYLSLKEKVASFFDVSTAEVIVVGSAKLGFSIKDTKLYTPFDENESDIDVAVISSDAFDKIWREVHRYTKTGTFFPKKDEFQNYLYDGWIRPDKMPPDDIFKFANEWRLFFRSLTKSGDYGGIKIAAGLYKSWYYLENYQQKSLEICKTKTV